MAKKKAHNYIESGVDILLLSKYPKIEIEVKEAIGKIDIQELSTLLSSYFGIDEDKFKQALFEYFGLVTKYNLGNKNNWILFWKDLNKIMGLKVIEDMQIEELIDKSISIVKNTYRDFLVYSLKEGLKEL